MRIAIVHNLPAGGARRRLASQMAHLDGDLVEVCLETATPIGPDPIVIPLRPRAPRIHRLLRPPLRYVDLARLERAWRVAGGAVESQGADVIYLNPCRYLQGPPLRAAKLPPSLYFCDEPRRVDSEAAAKATRSRLTWPVYGAMYWRQRQLDRSSMLRATKLATNSRYSAGEISRAYGRSAHVVTMGVDHALLSESEPPHDLGFLLSVGALIPSKGHDLVIRTAAAAKTRRPIVVIAPRSDNVEAARLADLARGLCVELSVRIGVSDTELGGLFRTAHATLYLARCEPLGLVSLEAQASGCPVVVAAEGGLPETIEDGVTGFRTPRTPEAAAQCLDRLDDETARREMSLAATQHARGWSWERSAHEVAELLGSLVR